MSPSSLVKNADSPPSAGSKEEGRVLVVDDEVPLQEMFASVLGEAGWLVDVARNGGEALDHLAAQQYDVVLSDIDMPRMSGLQLLQAVRTQDLDLPVLLVTGPPRVESAVQALEQGALRYLLKPVALDTHPDGGRRGGGAPASRGPGSSARCWPTWAPTTGCSRTTPGSKPPSRAACARCASSTNRSSGRRTAPCTATKRSRERREAAAPGRPLRRGRTTGSRVHELGRAVRNKAAEFLSLGRIKVAFVNVHPLELGRRPSPRGASLAARPLRGPRDHGASRSKACPSFLLASRRFDGWVPGWPSTTSVPGTPGSRPFHPPARRGQAGHGPRPGLRPRAGQAAADPLHDDPMPGARRVGRGRGDRDGGRARHRELWAATFSKATFGRPAEAPVVPPVVGGSPGEA